MKESVCIQNIWDVLVYHKEESANEMEICNTVPLCTHIQSTTEYS